MAATVPAAGVVGWAACDTSSGAGGDPDAGGRYAFESIRPGNYSNRPRHYHFNVSAPGHVPLTTQLYFAGDPFLGDSDSCQRPTCNSHDPARIVDFTSDQDPNGITRYHGTFDITLAPI